MEILFEVIKNEMVKHKIDDYHVSPILIEVDANSTETVEANNDIYFFANAFSSGVINGRVRGTGGGNALTINGVTLSSKLYKYQMFKGGLSVKNNDQSNILFIEMLRVTPIVSDTPTD